MPSAATTDSGPSAPIQLGLLAHPENSQSQEAHQVDGKLRKKSRHRVQQIAFAVNRFAGGNMEVQKQQGHGDREYTVA